MTSRPDILFANNAQWATQVLKTDKDFFTNSAGNPQKPHTLWIGCADSRVPESVVTASKPGDIFVHRNIANQLHPDDESLLAIIQFAVNFVGVKHVAIVGHTACGGARASFEAAQNLASSISATTPITTIPSLPADDPLNKWLAPLTRLAASLEISSVTGGEGVNLLVEENVRKQVEDVVKTGPIQEAWNAGKDVTVHGWVYDLATGRLRDMEISQGPPAKK